MDDWKRRLRDHLAQAAQEVDDEARRWLEQALAQAQEPKALLAAVEAQRRACQTRLERTARNLAEQRREQAEIEPTPGALVALEDLKTALEMETRLHEEVLASGDAARWAEVTPLAADYHRWLEGPPPPEAPASSAPVDRADWLRLQLECKLEVLEKMDRAVDGEIERLQRAAELEARIVELAELENRLQGRLLWYRRLEGGLSPFLEGEAQPDRNSN